jgi:hypothetical protein
LSGNIENTNERIYPSKLFQERIISCNRLKESGYTEWLFYPSMLFNSPVKWWGNKGKREKPHEGLDICLYRTDKGNFRYLDENIKIPVIFRGRVEKIIEDFLGKSVFVSHGDRKDNGKSLYSVYGHISPDDNIYPGKMLNDGDLIGTIADAKKKQRLIHSHLHISVVWVSDDISIEELNWEITDSTNKFVFLDPLRIIECPYSIIQDIL